MAARAAESPSGKVSEVFASDKERQGAYDLLESGLVDPATLAAALGEAAARCAANESFSFVSMDGSSLALVDRAQSKDFGSLGALCEGGRGLKVISALGVSPKGVLLGLFSQVWWARTQARSQTSKERSPTATARSIRKKHSTG